MARNGPRARCYPRHPCGDGPRRLRYARQRREIRAAARPGRARPDSRLLAGGHAPAAGTRELATRPRPSGCVRRGRVSQHQTRAARAGGVLLIGWQAAAMAGAQRARPDPGIGQPRWSVAVLLRPGRADRRQVPEHRVHRAHPVEGADPRRPPSAGRPQDVRRRVQPGRPDGGLHRELRLRPGVPEPADRGHPADYPGAQRPRRATNLLRPAQLGAR